MTARFKGLAGKQRQLLNKRLLLPALLIALLAASDTRAIVLQVLSDAFLQVSAYVFASLAVYYALTQKLKPEAVGAFMKAHPFYEVIIATVLGALPGCGGAIIVVTQFTRGVASFGAVVAVLTATMGDAAFLLLAQSPYDALVVMGISMVVGISSGLIVNTIHARDAFMPAHDTLNSHASDCNESSLTYVQATSVKFWRVVFIPAGIFAVLLSFQVDIEQSLGLPAQSVTLFGALCGLLAVVLWALSSSGKSYASITAEEPISANTTWLKKAALDTQFVTSWVVVAFIGFELVVHWFGLDLADIASHWGVLTVIGAVTVGLLPGCGPQIMVTTLYLNGVLPFSAQIANAISNDGDALFPAIALAPRAALFATLYSTIPALVVGLGYYALFEM